MGKREEIPVYLFSYSWALADSEKPWYYIQNFSFRCASEGPPYLENALDWQNQINYLRVQNWVEKLMVFSGLLMYQDSSSSDSVHSQLSSSVPQIMTWFLSKYSFSIRNRGIVVLTSRTLECWLLRIAMPSFLLGDLPKGSWIPARVPNVLLWMA